MRKLTEEQRLRYNKTEREKRVNDPEYRARINKKEREKRANDPEFRAKRNKKAREKIANNPELRAKKNKKAREKRASDPEYRAKRNKKAREKVASDPEHKAKRNKIRREKYANDPEYRAAEKARKKALWKNPEIRDRWLKSRREERKQNGRDRKTVLNDRMRSAINESIARGTKNNRSWTTLVGYTVEELIAHLENLFLPGMSWENRSEWHIDHIIPQDLFNFSTPEDIDFKRCWALSNLQPLWAADNVSKNARYKEKFQPALQF